MTAYNPRTQRTAITVSPTEIGRYWAVNKLVLDMKAAGILDVETGEMAPEDTSKIWLRVANGDRSSGDVRIYSGGSWVAMTPELFAEYVGGGEDPPTIEIANDLVTNDPGKALSAAQGVALKALIDEIPGGGGGSVDIADNLVTDDPEQALSAAQGVVLKGLIDALPAPGEGDVTGPASATNAEVVVFSGTTGKAVTGGGYTVAGIINAAVAVVRDGVNAAFDTLAEVAASLGTITNDVASLTSVVATKLPKDGSEAMTGPLLLTEGNAPSTPASGLVALYAKTDGKLYRKDDTGTEVELGGGGSIEFGVTPEEYGAVGNGSTDDATAFQAALTALGSAGGGVLLCSAKTYAINATLVWPSNVSLELNGATLDFADASGVSKYIDATGTVDSSLSLTSDVSAGGRTIEVADTSSLAVGDMLRLASTSVFDPNRTGSYCGEMVFVESLTSTVITTTFDIQDNYDVADSAFVQRTVPVQGIVMKGPGRITGSTATQTASDGILLYRAKDCRIEGITFDEIDLAHIRVRDAVDCHFAFNKFGIMRPTSQGYGVSFADATQDCSAVHNSFAQCRHSLSTNNSGAYGGIPRRILFESNFIRVSVFALGGSMGGGDAIDTHAAAEDIVIRNNTVIGSTSQGINIECPSVIIEGNVIRDCASHGIGYHNETPRVGAVRIANNKVSNCGSTTSHRGIRVATGTGETGSYCKSVQVIANHVFDNPGTAIEILGSSSAPMRGVIIANNSIDNCDGAGGVIYAFWCVNFSITGNSVTGNPVIAVSIRVTNCKVGVVSANTLECVGSGTTNAIQVSATESGDTNKVSITANSIHLNSAAATRRGVFFDNNVTNCGVFNNTILNATAAVTLGSGTGNVQDNNI